MPYKSLKDLPEGEFFAPGHGLCAGCTASLIARMIMKVAGANTIVVSATGCVEVSTSPYPNTAWKVPWIHVAFENAAAVASGIRAAYEAFRRKNTSVVNPHVIVLGGDGGTADIGLQALSGAFERGDRITYVCYDNEAYMNTGIQRSGTTPYGAWTTTSPISSRSIGQKTWKKDLMAIAIAHRVKYAATATPAYLVDAANKIEKALQTTGPSFLHFLQPCVAGWKIDSADAIKMSRLAVQSGLWPLYEYENGQIHVTTPLTRRIPVEEYLKPQGRFKHLLSQPQEIKLIQGFANENAVKHSLGPVVEVKK